MSWTRRSRGRLFRALFNLRAWSRGVDTRMRYDAATGRLRAVSPEHALWFRHESQAYYACKRGLARRFESLGASYFLPEIPFAPGDLVVDCGANVGELKFWFLENAPEVEYIGIEPSPAEYACMKENVAPSQALNLGLWDGDDELPFYVSSQRADSSFVEPPAHEGVVRVPARRLDGLLSDRSIKLLKLEAEGAEPEAVRGCEKILPRIAYISADLGFERGFRQTSTLAPVTNFLLANGFELLDVKPGRLIALFRNRAAA